MATAQDESAPRTGNNLIDGLLQGAAWQFSASHVLTYSFSTNDTPGMQPAWQPALQGAVVRALTAWSSVANLVFVETGSQTVYTRSSADLAITLTGTELQTVYGAVGLALFPSPKSADWVRASWQYSSQQYPNPAGDIFFDNGYAGYGYVDAGGDGFAIMLHEIGHALGLKHPHDDGGNGRPSFNQLGMQGFDHARYTVMSYNDPWPVSAPRHPSTPMPLDILTIQHLYGANKTTFAGDDLHVVDPGIAATRTLWDAGGTDTLDFSAFAAAGQTIDVRPGAVMQTSASILAVAYNTTIENVIGTVHADSITGNRAGNALTGMQGNDNLSGQGGSDTAVYSGARAEFSLVRNSTGYTVSGPAGTDTLRGIEWLQFTDLTLKIETPPDRDVGGDGKADLMWRHANGDFAIWEMSGPVVLSSPLVAGRLASTWRLVDLGDFNGDGAADLLWRQDSGAVAIWEMDGTAPASTPVIGSFTDWRPLHAADFDGDNRAEILWRHDDGTVALWQMNTSGPVAAQVAKVGNDWAIVDTADFDADGKADILWQHDNGTVAVWMMNGANPASTPIIASFAGAWNVRDTGDFDGNGKADLLWTNVIGTTSLWLMDGATPTATPIVADLGLAWRLADARDFNGDGRADILWRHETGTVAIWEMDGPTVLASPVVAAFGADWLVT